MPTIKFNADDMAILKKARETLKANPNAGIFNKSPVELQEEYPYADPKTCYLESDFQMAKRIKAIAEKASIYGIESYTATMKALAKIESQLGKGMRKNSCELALLQITREDLFKKQRVPKPKLPSGIVISDAITSRNANDTAEAKTYKNLIHSLEVMYQIKEPDENEAEPRALLSSVLGKEVLANLGSPQYVEVGRELLPDEVFYNDDELVRENRTPDYLSDDDELLSKPLVDQTVNFCKGLYNIAQKEVQFFDWTDAVFINEKSLATRVIEENNNNFTPEKAEDILKNALADKFNIVELLSYRADKKEFEEYSFKPQGDFSHIDKLDFQKTEKHYLQEGEWKLWATEGSSEASLVTPDVTAGILDLNKHCYAQAHKDLVIKSIVDPYVPSLPTLENVENPNFFDNAGEFSQEACDILFHAIEHPIAIDYGRDTFNLTNEQFAEMAKSYEVLKRFADIYRPLFTKSLSKRTSFNFEDFIVANRGKYDATEFSVNADSYRETNKRLRKIYMYNELGKRAEYASRIYGAILAQHQIAFASNMLSTEELVAKAAQSEVLDKFNDKLFIPIYDWRLRDDATNLRNDPRASEFDRQVKRAALEINATQYANNYTQHQLREKLVTSMSEKIIISPVMPLESTISDDMRRVLEKLDSNANRSDSEENLRLNARLNEIMNSKEGSATFEAAKTALRANANSAIPIGELNRLRAEYPDVNPSFCFIPSDFQMAREVKIIEAKAASYGIAGFTAAKKALAAIAESSGKGVRQNSAEIAIFRMISDTTEDGSELHNMAKDEYNKRLKTKTVDMKMYESQIHALAVMYGVERKAEGEVEASSLLAGSFGDSILNNLGSPEYEKSGRELAAKDVFPSDVRYFRGLQFPKYLSDNDELLSKFPESQTDNFGNALYSLAKKDYPDFKWTDAVFVNGTSLTEEISTRLAEQAAQAPQAPQAEQAPQARQAAENEAATAILISALADETNKVDFLSYNAGQKKFDTTSLALKGDFSSVGKFDFEEKEELVNPQIATWKLWFNKHGGFYKDSVAKQNAYDNQKAIAEKLARVAQVMNEEIEKNTHKENVIALKKRTEEIKATILATRKDVANFNKAIENSERFEFPPYTQFLENAKTSAKQSLILLKQNNISVHATLLEAEKTVKADNGDNSEQEVAVEEPQVEDEVVLADEDFEKMAYMDFLQATLKSSQETMEAHKKNIKEENIILYKVRNDVDETEEVRDKNRQDLQEIRAVTDSIDKKLSLLDSTLSQSIDKAYRQGIDFTEGELKAVKSNEPWRDVLKEINEPISTVQPQPSSFVADNEEIPNLIIKSEAEILEEKRNKDFVIRYDKSRITVENRYYDNRIMHDTNGELNKKILEDANKTRANVEDAKKMLHLKDGVELGDLIIGSNVISNKPIFVGERYSLDKVLETAMGVLKEDPKKYLDKELTYRQYMKMRAAKSAVACLDTNSRFPIISLEKVKEWVSNAQNRKEYGINVKWRNFKEAAEAIMLRASIANKIFTGIDAQYQMRSTLLQDKDKIVQFNFAKAIGQANYATRSKFLVNSQLAPLESWNDLKFNDKTDKFNKDLLEGMTSDVETFTNSHDKQECIEIAQGLLGIQVAEQTAQQATAKATTKATAAQAVVDEPMSTSSSSFDDEIEEYENAYSIDNPAASSSTTSSTTSSSSPFDDEIEEYYDDSITVEEPTFTSSTTSSSTSSTSSFDDEIEEYYDDSITVEEPTFTSSTTSSSTSSFDDEIEEYYDDSITVEEPTFTSSTTSTSTSSFDDEIEEDEDSITVEEPTFTSSTTSSSTSSFDDEIEEDEDSITVEEPISTSSTTLSSTPPPLDEEIKESEFAVNKPVVPKEPTFDEIWKAAKEREFAVRYAKDRTIVENMCYDQRLYDTNGKVDEKVPFDLEQAEKNVKKEKAAIGVLPGEVELGDLLMGYMLSDPALSVRTITNGSMPYMNRNTVRISMVCHANGEKDDKKVVNPTHLIPLAMKALEDSPDKYIDGEMTYDDYVEMRVAKSVLSCLDCDLQHPPISFDNVKKWVENPQNCEKYGFGTKPKEIENAAQAITLQSSIASKIFTRVDAKYQVRATLCENSKDIAQLNIGKSLGRMVYDKSPKTTLNNRNLEAFEKWNKIAPTKVNIALNSKIATEMADSVKQYVNSHTKLECIELSSASLGMKSDSPALISARAEAKEAKEASNPQKQASGHSGGRSR